MTYQVGSWVRIHGKFVAHTNRDAPTDPQGVTLRVKAPDDEEHAYTAVHDAVGKYHADVEASMPGRWRYRWECAPGSIDEGWFDVSESAFGSTSE